MTSWCRNYFRGGCLGCPHFCEDVHPTKLLLTLAMPAITLRMMTSDYIQGFQLAEHSRELVFHAQLFQVQSANENVNFFLTAFSDHLAICRTLAKDIDDFG